MTQVHSRPLDHPQCLPVMLILPVTRHQDRTTWFPTQIHLRYLLYCFQNMVGWYGRTRSSLRDLFESHQAWCERLPQRIQFTCSSLSKKISQIYLHAVGPRRFTPGCVFDINNHSIRWKPSIHFAFSSPHTSNFFDARSFHLEVQHSCAHGNPTP